LALVHAEVVEFDGIVVYPCPQARGVTEVDDALTELDASPIVEVEVVATGVKCVSLRVGAMDVGHQQEDKR
jgi:hypothetical protein